MAWLEVGHDSVSSERGREGVRVGGRRKVYEHMRKLNGVVQHTTPAHTYRHVPGLHSTVSRRRFDMVRSRWHYRWVWLRGGARENRVWTINRICCPPAGIVEKDLGFGMGTAACVCVCVCVCV